MDQGLITWARAVKCRGKSALPRLFLFSDAASMPDLAALVRRLPMGLCGVVFRHDGAPGRGVLGAQIAKICRARRLALVVAGDARLAARLGAGVHLRGGRRGGVVPVAAGRLVTASVHNRVELLRARRAGAKILFCSPVFATASHPGARGLGGFGFRQLARAAAPGMAYALGGVDGGSARALGRICAGAGAIGAFLGSRFNEI